MLIQVPMLSFLVHVHCTYLAVKTYKLGNVHNTYYSVIINDDAFIHLAFVNQSYR